MSNFLHTKSLCAMLLLYCYSLDVMATSISSNTSYQRKTVSKLDELYCTVIELFKYSIWNALPFWYNVVVRKLAMWRGVAGRRADHVITSRVETRS